MDIKDRVMGDKPNSWLHKIAGIVPGFKGYTDRERRRDADKLLRTHLAKQYSAQRDRLTRVQQSLLRAKRMDQIAEVDRLTGIFQRFIDRLNTATYGYQGMFDPVKIEAEDLDQLYAFDMTLANGVDQASTAIGAIDEAVSDKESNALPDALDKFAQLVDDLNEKLNQRSELLTSGTRVPDDQFQSMLSSLNPIPPYGQGETPSQGANIPEVSLGKSGNMVTPGNTNLGGEVARYGGGTNAVNTDAGAGVPTTDLGVAPYSQPGPGMSAVVDGDTSLSPMSAEEGMSGISEGPVPTGGSAGTGTESASSPAAAPGAPGHDIVQGLDMASALDNVTKTSSGEGGNRAPDGSR
jgi:hypothetical protein